MKLKIFRCYRCGKILFKYGVDGKAEIEIKCPRCNTIIKANISEK